MYFAYVTGIVRKIVEGSVIQLGINLVTQKVAPTLKAGANKVLDQMSVMKGKQDLKELLDESNKKISKKKAAAASTPPAQTTPPTPTAPTTPSSVEEGPVSAKFIE